ncbi:MAG: response regulator transcription factor [Clostridia bacterium]|nr:response regulator transcription factor [Clostridia bacterium]
MKEKKDKVLLVDSDIESQIFLKTTLDKFGYNVYTASSAYNIISLYGELIFDIVLLNENIADMYLKDIVPILRKDRYVPIIVISESAKETDTLLAFEMGADDFIKKPYSQKELLARMKNAVKRTKNTDNALVFRAGNLAVNFAERKVSLKGKIIKFTATEYSIFSLLAKSAGRVLKYSELIKKVWGKNSSADVKRLHVNIANIRKKLGEIPKKPKYIITENGIGYKMNTFF